MIFLHWGGSAWSTLAQQEQPRPDIRTTWTMVPIPMSMCQCADDDDKYSDDKTQNIAALISCGNLKLISKNFSKAAKKSLACLVKTNANLSPDIPLFCYFLTVRHNKNFCGGFKKQFSLTLFSKNKN